MKISNNYFLVILSLIMACTFTACSQSEPIIEQEPTIYDGCCGTEPKIIQVEDLIVYIPNVITPNGDGINDVFYPISNAQTNGFTAFGNFDLYDENDNWIFHRNGLDVETGMDYGFRGVANEKPLYPVTTKNYDYTGKFKYRFYIAFKLKDGTEQLVDVEGEACVVRCDEDAYVLKDKEGCQFPVQVTNGIYDPLLPSREENCIK